MAKTTFKNREDFDFYDVECPAHKALKQKVASVGVEGMMMVFFSPTVSVGV